MRILLVVIILAALGWSGFWFLGASQMESGVQTWVEDRTEDGWAVSTADVRTSGFPNRFDTTITDLEIIDPETGLAWYAPFLQILTLSYKPEHVIIVWPHEQNLATPYQKIAVASDDLRASAKVRDTKSLRLDTVIVTTEEMQLASSEGWTAALGSGQVSLRPTPLTEDSYDLRIELKDLILPDAFSEVLVERGLASDRLGAVFLDAKVGFDRPWDRRVIEDRRPQPRSIQINRADASWGALNLRIAGDLEIDIAGVPRGELTVKAENWQDILALVTASGAIPEQISGLVKTGLTALGRLSGNPKSLDVPLKLEDGNVTLGGFVRLGKAPRIFLR